MTLFIMFRKKSKKRIKSQVISGYLSCQPTYCHSNHLKQKFKKYKSVFCKILLNETQFIIPVCYSQVCQAATSQTSLMMGLVPLTIRGQAWLLVRQLVFTQGTDTMYHPPTMTHVNISTGRIILEEKIELIRIHSYTIHNIHTYIHDSLLVSEWSLCLLI